MSTIDPKYANLLVQELVNHKKIKDYNFPIKEDQFLEQICNLKINDEKYANELPFKPQTFNYPSEKYTLSLRKIMVNEVADEYESNFIRANFQNFFFNYFSSYSSDRFCRKLVEMSQNNQKCVLDINTGQRNKIVDVMISHGYFEKTPYTLIAKLRVYNKEDKTRKKIPIIVMPNIKEYKINKEIEEFENAYIIKTDSFQTNIEQKVEKLLKRFKN